MSANVKLSLAGLAAVAKSGEMHGLVDAAAADIAANIESLGIRVQDVPGDIALPVKVHAGETTTGMTVNRATARVVIAHAAGIAVQAKHGAVTKAASAAGLNVR